MQNQRKIAFLVLGFSAFITQIVLLREFLSVFSGNELVIGFILASWMLLTGAGAWAGKFTGKNAPVFSLVLILLVVLAVLPVVTVASLDFFRNRVVPPGSMPGMDSFILGTLVLLTPYCLFSGSLFTLLCRYITRKSIENLVSEAYMLDSAGTLIAGIVFNFILVYYLHTFQMLMIVFLVDFLTCAFLLYLDKKFSFAYVAALAGVLLFLGGEKLNLDMRSARWLYPGQEVVFRKYTPYGKLMVTRMEEQYNFFENGVFLCSSSNITDNEEGVHYAMVQRRHPRRVLLVSGGLSGMTGEIRKYHVQNIDYLELDPWLIRAGRTWGAGFDAPGVNVVTRDARLFLKESPVKYDVALINLPPPATAQLNRYFTLDFFRELNQKLADSAVVSIPLPPTQDYVSGMEGNLNSVLYHTLKQVFAHVLIVPGGRNYYLASEAPLSLEFGKMIREAGISTTYVNQDYIDQPSMAERSRSITTSLDQAVPYNRDFRPVCYYLQLQFWLSYFSFNAWWLVCAFAVFLLLMMFRATRVNTGLFAAGFAATGTEMVLMVAIQVLYGYVFSMAGILITVFMAGMTLGTWLSPRLFRSGSHRQFGLLQLAIGIYCLLLPAFLLFLKSVPVHVSLVQAVLFLLTFIVAWITGAQFSVGTRLASPDAGLAASVTYSSDLFGAAFGALAVMAFLIPLTGVEITCLVLGIPNLLAAALNIFPGKQVTL